MYHNNEIVFVLFIILLFITKRERKIKHKKNQRI